MDVELVLDAHAQLGEGPVWLQREQRLAWVDIKAGLVHLYDPGGGEDRSLPVGQMVGALVPRRSGGLVLAVQRGFASMDLNSGKVEVIAECVPEGIRMNDGKCDPQGRFWAGTMALDLRPGAAALYRLEGTHVETIRTGVSCSNGLGWSPDQRTMYYIDTPTQEVGIYDYPSFERRGAIPIAKPGGPDGMTVDAEGYLWVAIWGGSAVHRYAPDGRLDQEVRLPVTNVTCPTFGGPDLADLYITCASNPSPPGETQAGGLFRCRPGVKGMAPFEFAG